MSAFVCPCADHAKKTISSCMIVRWPIIRITFYKINNCNNNNKAPTMRAMAHMCRLYRHCHRHPPRLFYRPLSRPCRHFCHQSSYGMPIYRCLFPPHRHRPLLLHHHQHLPRHHRQPRSLRCFPLHLLPDHLQSIRLILYVPRCLRLRHRMRVLVIPLKWV